MLSEKITTKETIYIGAMTGTSVDKEVDFSAATFSSDGVLLEHDNLTIALPEKTRSLLYKLSITPCEQLTIAERRQGERAITDFLIDAFRSVIEQWGLKNYPKNQIILSPHGQTIDHQPTLRSTDQLVHGERLAYETGYPVVFRHRQACITCSHAAPLSPLLLKTLFDSPQVNDFFHDPKNKDLNQDVVIINGGGLANICIFSNKKTIAFDTGPANGPIDELIRHILTLDKSIIPADLATAIIKNEFDVSGSWAKRGHVCPLMQEKLLAHPYFSTHQSADRSQFNLNWVLCAKSNLTWQDCLTTLSHVIATTLSNAISEQATTKNIHLGFYGGLAYNTYIIETVLSQLSHFSISPIRWEEKNLNPDFIESLLMAYLGFCVHQNKRVCLDYCSDTKKTQIIPGIITYP